MRIARFSIDGNVAFGAVEGQGTVECRASRRPCMTTARAHLEAADWSDPESLKNAVLTAGEAHGLKLGKAQAPVRVAVTGRTVGLPLFESLEILGRDKSLARIDAALAKLAA
ncbi:Glutamate--tRNA ligase [Streptomyces californicus]